MTRLLATPIRVGHVVLPNRIIMGSMHLGCETEADAPQRLARFYGERAKGGVGLIVTGGVAPNPQGRFGADGTVLDHPSQLDHHLPITDAVHQAGGRIILQILHCGRYARHDDPVAPSAIRAPISRTTPRELTEAEIEATIADYARTAALAIQAGYDGIEVMASEGYLISEFMAPATNHRTDQWGGPLSHRLRFLDRVVRAVRGAIGECLLSVRLSMVDLVEGGLSGDEVVAAALVAEQAGADLLNSGIGWHESRVPTIAHPVPAGAWAWATARVKAVLSIPVSASNRIDTPERAEAILASGAADLVSLARPLLADPAFAAKATGGQAGAINTCIACNQGCLDAMFDGRPASCLVNPRAGREGEFVAVSVAAALKLAVVGAGPAGMACALEAAARGHHVTLFEASQHLGGQFALAERIPGKETYVATLDWFAAELDRLGVTVKLGRAATLKDLDGFDQVVIATGVRPRRPDIAGIDHPMVALYDDILSGRRTAGQRVALIGAGPIAFDVALYLLGPSAPFDAEWGIDRTLLHPGGLAVVEPAEAPSRAITLMQRKPGRPGADLGRTTGWIAKAKLQRAGVAMLAGVAYRHIDDAGLHIHVDGTDRLIEADTIIVCSGQEGDDSLAQQLAAAGRIVHRIGGARQASGIDALRAIEDGTRLGLQIG
ncbi:MAG: FAD-dependent oxidoreductase [Alphaproteobacteria bacterium]|nr:FAD-dependent oxidoreductase [Alphaproteobacteria bacterium]